jgi:hypothetical protein
LAAVLPPSAVAGCTSNVTLSSVGKNDRSTSACRGASVPSPSTAMVASDMKAVVAVTVTTPVPTYTI